MLGLPSCAAESGCLKVEVFRFIFHEVEIVYLLEYALQSCSTCKHRHGAVFDSVGISVIIMCMHAIIHGMLAAQLDTCKRFSSMMDGAIKLSG